MTKPTGRPKGRPKGREYETLMARVPLELVEQARKYAARKQRPISEVLRDGLLLLLEQEDTAPLYVYDRNTSPVKMSDTKEDTTRTLEALQPVKMSDTIAAMLPPGIHRPSIVSDTKEDTSPIETPPVKMSDTKAADALPSFDTTKHHLAPLCPRNHEWGTTGQSLKNASNQCLKCKAEAKAKKDARKKAERKAQPVTG